jgi:uncharacterized protein YkwD
MQKDHYCFKVAGENIGLSTYSDGTATSRIEVAFMGSAGHRANILGTWTRMGIGAYKAADGRKLYAVLFSVACTPKAKAKPVVKATPVPTAIATATPTAEPTLEPTPEPTATLEPIPSAAPSILPDGGLASPSPTEQISLRVRERTPSQGPLDSLFTLIFGGLFG